MKYILGVVVALFALFVVLLFVEHLGATQDSGSAEVISKRYIAGYYTTTYITTGDVRIPIKTYHPPQYEVTVIDGDRRIDAVSVPQETYAALRVGDRCRILFHTGRLTRGFHVDNVEKETP